MATLKGGIRDVTLEGGAGDDIINGGSGNEVIYGDTASGSTNILTNGNFEGGGLNGGSSNGIPEGWTRIAETTANIGETTQAYTDGAAVYIASGNATYSYNGIEQDTGTAYNSLEAYNLTLDVGSGNQEASTVTAEVLVNGVVIGTETYDIDDLSSGAMYSGAIDLIIPAGASTETGNVVVRISILSETVHSGNYRQTQIDNASLTTTGDLNAGDDSIDGGAGNDTIFAGEGDDTLGGGDGIASLTGGAGNDTFIYSGGTDTFTDFGTGSSDANDGDANNNDFVDLSRFYSGQDEFEADLADDGILNQSTGDYTDNTAMGGSIAGMSGLSGISVDSLEEQTGIICFTRGTGIATDQGVIPVEDLRCGVRVMTADNGYQTVRWIGSRRLLPHELDDRPNFNPIRIRAGALGGNGLDRDLIVSPQHRLLAKSKIAARMFSSREVLVAAKHLIGLDGVDRIQAHNGVEYFHILFDRHEVIFANGVQAESLYTGPMALKSLGAGARAEIFSLFPELATRTCLPMSCRPLANGQKGRSLARRHASNNQRFIEIEKASSG